MEGPLLVVALADPKKLWKNEFVRLDEVSGQLLGFRDRTQAELRWRLTLKDADVATPVSGDPQHDAVPDLDATPHCFYVRDTTAGADRWVFFSAGDDDTRRRWLQQLLQAATDGPRAPRFAHLPFPRSPTAGPVPPPAPTYTFEARVVEARVHDGGKHAEYRIRCYAEVYSRRANRCQSREWDVWRRFSEFAALNETLRATVGTAKMLDVPFFKLRRDALRSLLLRWALDAAFLEERRLQLDAFVSRLCAVHEAVAFFRDDSSPALKAFVCFDEHCDDVDYSPRRTSSPRFSVSRQRGEESEFQSCQSPATSPHRASSPVTASKDDENVPDAERTPPPPPPLSSVVDPVVNGQCHRRGRKKRGKSPKQQQQQRKSPVATGVDAERIRPPSPTKRH